MSRESYVSYETAKLLKEKGFDWECRAYWHEDDRELIESQSPCYLRNITNPCWFGNTAPTQQMAMRWLREEKGIFVDIRVYSGLPVQFGYDISVLYPDKTLVDKGGTFGFSSYEEVTEKGLKYVLQNLSKYL